MTNPAAEANTVGLPAYAQGAKVFAAQLRQLYHDETTSSHLPGPAKTLHCDRDGNKPYPLAVVCHCRKCYCGIIELERDL